MEQHALILIFALLVLLPGIDNFMLERSKAHMADQGFGDGGYGERAGAGY